MDAWYMNPTFKSPWPTCSFKISCLNVNNKVIIVTNMASVVVPTHVHGVNYLASLQYKVNSNHGKVVINRYCRISSTRKKKMVPN